jgi:hypothetical protein
MRILGIDKDHKIHVTEQMTAPDCRTMPPARALQTTMPPSQKKPGQTSLAGPGLWNL